MVEKERITQQENNEIFEKINFTKEITEVSGSELVIEAIIENLAIKQKIFTEIENLVDDNCIIASNTSSLSIASIASSCKNAERVVGIHFFNPAPLMPLVEIIPAVQTSENTLNNAKSIIDSWKKVTVVAKDTPGFIVNRVARPFYGEALRIYEEGVANFATIDWALKEIGGFRMGPFELMDYIGNDINYTVTETVFTSFYFDSRYKPSFTQKRMMEAGYLGRKSGKGYYNYANEMPEANEDRGLGKKILWRVLAMLINEAADALFLNIATKEDIDLAMKKGVNYPKGLLSWADEIGIENVLQQLEDLQAEYGEDRYRPSPLLKRMAKENKTFY
jgi:3-hydroxybutyryl-CoA dehydrogenase